MEVDLLTNYQYELDYLLHLEDIGCKMVQLEILGYSSYIPIEQAIQKIETRIESILCQQAIQ
jgi:hypothetical protein